MSCMMVKREFKLVGLKGCGEFVNFGYEVPLLAKQFLSRKKEILHSTETEVALFEPKRDEEHLTGYFFAGVIVNEEINEVPSGMEYIETKNNYVTTRGDISKVGELHLQLLNWAKEQGYKRDSESYIIETYHPIGNGDEEVQIYLPIQA